MATIRDLMTSNVETVGPDQTAKEAAGFMLRPTPGRSRCARAAR